MNFHFFRRRLFVGVTEDSYSLAQEMLGNLYITQHVVRRSMNRTMNRNIVLFLSSYFMVYHHFSVQKDPNVRHFCSKEDNVVR